MLPIEKDILRVAVAGYGAVGERRRQFIDQHQKLQTVAVCDIKFEKPKSPTIKINNDFNTNINDLSKKLIDLIDNKLKF